jgi:hypothetical protein
VHSLLLGDRAGYEAAIEGSGLAPSEVSSILASVAGMLFDISISDSPKVRLGMSIKPEIMEKFARGARKALRHPFYKFASAGYHVQTPHRLTRAEYAQLQLLIPRFILHWRTLDKLWPFEETQIPRWLPSLVGHALLSGEDDYPDHLAWIHRGVICSLVS